MALGVIAFGSIWPVLLAAVHGFAAVEPRLIEVERALGLSRWQGVAKISLPSAAPDILAGMRLGLTVVAHPRGRLRNDRRTGGARPMGAARRARL